MDKQQLYQNIAARDYHLNFGAIGREAWQKMYGIKGRIWGGMGLYILLSFALSIVLGIILVFMPVSTSFDMVQHFIEAILQLALMPVLIGVSMLAVSRALGYDLTVGSIFSYYRYLWSLLLLTIFIWLVMILMASAVFFVFGLLGITEIWLPVVIIAIPAIYFYVLLAWAGLLIVEKSLSFWKSVSLSFKLIGEHGLKCALFLLLFTLAIFAGFLLGGVLAFLLAIVGVESINLLGLIVVVPGILTMIWTVPFSMMAYAIAYREIFGTEN